MGGVSKEKVFPVREAFVKDELSAKKSEEELEMIRRDGDKPNPFPAKTEKSPLSEPNLKQENRSNGSVTGLNSKPSVKEKLDGYKNQAAAEKNKGKVERNISEKVAEHTPPLPKVNGKER